MAILCRAIMANINKMAIMAILVWIDMAINMVSIGVYAKNRKNVDKLGLSWAKLSYQPGLGCSLIKICCIKLNDTK